MFAAIDAMPAGSAPDRPFGREGGSGLSAWVASLRRKALARLAHSAGAAALRRQHLLRAASDQGYACLEVDGGEPIEMLLLRAGERVIVLSERAKRMPRSSLQVLLEAADASAAWVAEPGYDGVARRQIVKVAASA